MSSNTVPLPRSRMVWLRGTPLTRSVGQPLLILQGIFDTQHSVPLIFLRTIIQMRLVHRKAVLQAMAYPMYLITTLLARMING